MQKSGLSKNGLLEYDTVSSNNRGEKDPPKHNHRHLKYSYDLDKHVTYHFIIDVQDLILI